MPPRGAAARTDEPCDRALRGSSPPTQMREPPLVDSLAMANAQVRSARELVDFVDTYPTPRKPADHVRRNFESYEAVPRSYVRRLELNHRETTRSKEIVHACEQAFRIAADSDRAVDE